MFTTNLYRAERHSGQERVTLQCKVVTYYTSMCHQILYENNKSYVLLTECVYVCIYLKTDSDFFPISLICFYNLDVLLTGQYRMDL
jgi:hypothetical protein